MGGGDVTLTGNNSYSGAMVIEAGTLDIAKAGAAHFPAGGNKDEG